MPEIKQAKAAHKSNNHERKESGLNSLNCRTEILDADAYQNLHIPQRQASPVIDADGQQIHQNTIRSRPQPPIIYA